MNTTATPPPDRPDETRLSAWVDGELDGAARAEVEAWLRDHPEDAALVRLWAADRDALRARFGPVADEPVPPALRQLVQRGGRDAEAPRAPWRRVAMAAGLLLVGSLFGGWIAASLVGSESPLLAALPLPGSADGAQVRAGGWLHRAAVAHAVYAPELRHPVEVNVAQGSAAEQRAQEEHLTRWLSKRLDMPVPLFDLRAQGFELVGGRLLPDANGPSAQLMYQNGSGQRVTVYLRRPPAGSQAAFRYQRDGELGLFYWVEDGFGCALVGKLPREQLLALAEAVYKQAEAGLPPAPATKPPAS
ncbi:MAG: anti-sigma factor [Burkholderiaceae bacterium]|nr:anti-sigma factor [Burkholderiaceae bacterium]